ncbi:Niemann-Pick C type protein [Heterostelium album PN500]|uniref:Niemann-Pick C type protein n=1 Tax=Heterostelium pallidum (strain ATCC 26659 / Pp 5 / PN500) TaxID=670386 RepID=D3B0C2_HETP5|nr:Niemann-Pick C type protein [Heterostelium album PN500]EFA84746.1 Niemann-Pick C type protein [Heterostelium album PN500]|eukprot:XP_020436858.1 Niemann-Pick C type protein [Heterostelium album PN500]
MNFKYLYVTLLLSVIFISTNGSVLSSVLNPHIQSNWTTEGCSMFGINGSFVEARNFTPQMPNPPLANYTCQAYSDMACCDYDQSIVLATNMAIAGGMFGRCSACITNLWDMWCGSSCSPYQSSFMIMDTVDNKTHQVKVATFLIDETYAVGLYNSCRDVNANGMGPISNTYPDAYSLLNNLFGGSNNPAFQIHFIYDPNGYSGNIIKCEDVCSCDNCRDSCVIPEEVKGLNLNTSLPTTYFFNHEVPYVSLWFLYSYMSLILTTLSIITLYYAYRFYKVSRRKLWIHSSIFVIFMWVSAMAIPLISGPSDANDRHRECYYKMPYDYDWNCALAIFVAIYCPSCCIILACMSIAYFYFARANLDSMASSSTVVSVENKYYDNFYSSESPTLQAIGIKDPSIIQKMFYNYGKFITRHPAWVIGLALLFVAGCSVGIMKIEIEQDPVKLWAAPTSRAVQEKNYFDEHFGPFYRTEQLIISLRNDTNANILSNDNLALLIELELHLMNLTAEFEGKTITLDDLCFKPTLEGCICESVTGYWQRSLDVLSQQPWASHFNYCLTSSLDSTCMDAIGVPVMPNVVLGGWNTDNLQNTFNSTAFVTTFLLNNLADNQTVNEAWEQVWLNEVKRINSNTSYPFSIAYSSERSVQDELAREGAADIPTIIISYSVMFVYISIALGRYYPIPSRFSSFFVNSRFTLGLSGIFIVALSIATSVGICSVIGVKATLIISEVIPFLVLAIGVDNIFILVNTFESIHVRTATEHPAPEQSLACALAKVGPSMALASLSESLAFLLGMLTKMPAVVAFSLYASVAIFFDFLLQISIFACLLVIDTRRHESRRIDCLPCVALNDGAPSDDDEPEQQPLVASTNSSDYVTYKKKDGLLKYAFKTYYAPFLMHPVVKVVSLLFFVGLLLTGITYALQLELGLEQQVALPRDSYLQNYFDQLADKLEVGPPFYIVVKEGFNYTSIQEQNQLCSVGGCNNNSIVNVFNNVPYMAKGISSWLDDYLSFTDNIACCSVDNNGTLCPVGWTDPGCTICGDPATNRPFPQSFEHFLPIYMNFLPQPQFCAVSGLGHQPDIQIQNGTIIATRFDGYHTTLRDQKDFINALKAAYYVVDHSDLPIFVYSVFYVYFEQYLHITSIAIMDILLALAGVFIVSLLILANPVIAVLVVICVGLVSIDLLGIMTLWSVNLNAVSVVNVVMAIGISIEFCVHIAHAFIHAPKHLSKDEKAKFAVSEIGSSIISGIFITKLLGVVVLGFSNSEIFEVYYFRMYISIVILGALHGLVLLPILLSLFGTDRFSFGNLLKKKNDLGLSDL